MATLLVLCRFVHFIVVLLMFGACVFKPLLLGAGPHPTLDRHLLRITRALAWVGLLSGAAWLLLITASMAGSWDAALQPTTVQLVLGKTFFGQVWSWHLLCNLLLVIALAKPWPALRLPLLALLLVTLAPVGHGAMLDGLSGRLLILNQVVHLVCVGAWLGGLVAGLRDMVEEMERFFPTVELVLLRLMAVMSRNGIQMARQRIITEFFSSTEEGEDDG